MMEWRGRGLPYSFDLVYVWIEVCAFNLCICVNSSVWLGQSTGIYGRRVLIDKELELFA